MSDRKTMTRAALSGAVGLLASVITWWHRSHLERPSDFSIVWAGARAFLGGLDPYTYVGPGASHDFPHLLLYPFPAMVAAIPFALLPMRLADLVFIGLGFGLMTWAITRDRLWTPAMLAIPSFAFLWTVFTVQWAPAMIAAALLPSLGFLLACKPQLGIALWCAYPSWKSALGAVGLVALSFLLWPAWVWHWWQVIQADTGHIVPAVMRWGGPLLLLAGLGWRTSEGRLLLVMSCLPITPSPTEALPLFLIPKTWTEGAILTTGLFIAPFLAGGHPTPMERYNALGQALTLCCYLPCLAMVLRRQFVETRNLYFKPAV